MYRSTAIEPQMKSAIAHPTDSRSGSESMQGTEDPVNIQVIEVEKPRTILLP